MLEVGHVAIQFLRRPKAATIRIETPTDTTPYVAFDADTFEIEAAVEPRGASADAAGGRLGGTQLQAVDINRALYRGSTPGAGPAEMFRDRSAKAMGASVPRRDVRVRRLHLPGRYATRSGLYAASPGDLNFALTHLPATVCVCHAEKPGGAYSTRCR